MTMKNALRKLALSLAAAAFAALSATPAHAQWYSSYPPRPAAYPGYVQPYAIEVAPNTYMIQRPAPAPVRRAPHVRRVKPAAKSHAKQHAEKPTKHRADRALIEELRARYRGKDKDKIEEEVVEVSDDNAAGKVADKVVHTRKIVHDKPIVVEHRRYVDDPPRVIERVHVVGDGKVTSLPPRRVAVDTGSIAPGLMDRGERVISADAEVTILGPDHMTIRLFRKGSGPAARRR